jgi:hypothetical protein
VVNVLRVDIDNISANGLAPTVLTSFKVIVTNTGRLSTAVQEVGFRKPVKRKRGDHRPIFMQGSGGSFSLPYRLEPDDEVEFNFSVDSLRESLLSGGRTDEIEMKPVVRAGVKVFTGSSSVFLENNKRLRGSGSGPST